MLTAFSNVLVTCLLDMNQHIWPDFLVDDMKTPV
jgi:hypothetical protein